jgi:hypothetical protein
MLDSVRQPVRRDVPNKKAAPQNPYVSTVLERHLAGAPRIELGTLGFGEDTYIVFLVNSTNIWRNNCRLYGYFVHIFGLIREK